MSDEFDGYVRAAVDRVCTPLRAAVQSFVRDLLEGATQQHVHEGNILVFTVEKSQLPEGVLSTATWYNIVRAVNELSPTILARLVDPYWRPGGDGKMAMTIVCCPDPRKAAEYVTRNVDYKARSGV